nr:hypothetical protein [Pandoravirus aubagnensis]
MGDVAQRDPAETTRDGAFFWRAGKTCGCLCVSNMSEYAIGHKIIRWKKSVKKKTTNRQRKRLRGSGGTALWLRACVRVRSKEQENKRRRVNYPLVSYKTTLFLQCTINIAPARLNSSGKGDGKQHLALEKSHTDTGPTKRHLALENPKTTITITSLYVPPFCTRPRRARITGRHTDPKKREKESLSLQQQRQRYGDQQRDRASNNNDDSGHEA